MRQTLLAAALAALPFLASPLALAQTLPPAPAPVPDAQTTMRTAATQNGSSAYAGGMAYFDQQAYQDAANTAQDIANQDAANASGGGGGGGYGVGLSGSTAWQDAAAQAQGVANDQQNLADAQVTVQQQGSSSQAGAYSTESAQAPVVARNDNSAAQTSASSGESASNASITQGTGVQQGQPTVTNNTSDYLAAGAATQAMMSQAATDGYQSNIDAYKAALQAAADAASYNYGGAAYETAVNLQKQAEADADYAGGVSAAPILSGAMDAAAAASAVNSASGTLQQIQSMTGVRQGQTAGATSTQEALRQTTAGTGVQTGQAATAASTDTSYTSAADSQQASLNASSQQNENDAETAAQAGRAGLDAEFSMNAANTIASYDNTMGASSADPAWTQAAAIAQQQVDQNQQVYGQQQAIQTSATNDGNATYSAATAAAPDIGNTLNTAAGSAGTNDANTTLQQIGAATGVPQGQ
ncbi:Cell wall surface anchor family protein (modular protein) [Thiomonas sp. X19]|uniref:hypothetical protein n=1 Tax=Thiomonas sp. X19 TaxID=1050370 RepID=UPI000B6D6CD9|nr:hypothetical protein [Thiomonas sp. X19]SCC93514.1 Cell wall surface anchor family protein (modular protein) [Thiomonas sp. X19]